MQKRLKPIQMFLFLRVVFLRIDREEHGRKAAQKMSMEGCFGQVIYV